MYNTISDNNQTNTAVILICQDLWGGVHYN